MSIVYLNGAQVPQNEAYVSVMDRGFLFGDGVYEVIPVYSGVPLKLDAHLQRLESSLVGIALSNPYAYSEWEAKITSVIEQNPEAQQSIYVQVTRGANSKRDHAFPEHSQPTTLIMSSPIPPVPSKDVAGFLACTMQDIRWNYCHIKSVALLGNVLLKQAAVDKGLDEVVLLRGNEVTECSASNVFIVMNDVIVTPPKSNLLLPGITRDLVIELAQQNLLPLEQRAIDVSELRQASEIWMSSSTKTIRPIVVLDDQPVGTGQVGPVWQVMRQHYADYVKKLSLGSLCA